MNERLFKDKLFALVRTDIALAALCGIAIGVFFIYHSRQTPIDGGAVINTLPLAAAPAYGTSTKVSSTASPAEFQTALKDMPPPASYHAFSYVPGMTLPVSGNCSDTYWTIMIFPADKDYRAEPTAALYNTADPSDGSGLCSREIDLSKLNLIASSSYYIIQADEGKTGSWYNPR